MEQTTLFAYSLVTALLLIEKKIIKKYTYFSNDIIMKHKALYR